MKKNPETDVENEYLFRGFWRYDSNSEKFLAVRSVMR
jgi:hypothetical protein